MTFADITWRGRKVRIEHQWIAPERTDAPLVVFLHEGLGSIAMWKDFPERLCEAGGFRGLVFSRPGYGRSTPRGPEETWDVDFMHRQAHEVLPAFFEAIGLTEKPWLFGHSDGASISLLYAARFPDRVAGLVVLAPHIFVEDVTVANIEQARLAYLETDLPKKLGRYHDDVDSAFWGWNRIWLHPLSSNGTSRPSSTPSVARFLLSRASTTSTAHSRRSAASPSACPAPHWWNSPTAGIPRIATSPKKR